MLNEDHPIMRLFPVYVFVESVGLCTVLRWWKIYLCPVNVPDCCTQPVPCARQIMCPAQTTVHYSPSQHCQYTVQETMQYRPAPNFHSAQTNWEAASCKMLQDKPMHN